LRTDRSSAIFFKRIGHERRTRCEHFSSAAPQ
jgi:hypothetical protein